MKDNKTIAEWDTCEIIQGQADYLREDNPKLTKKKAFQIASEDQDLFEIEWGNFKDRLTELIEERNKDGHWKINGENMGWRNLIGLKYAHADNGEKLLDAILPKTECTIRIMNHWNKKGFKMIVSHHDSPMGETYYLRPINK